MKQKICIDCKKNFYPKSNRSIRCSICQNIERKKQKADDKKKARSKRTLDGRAIIKGDGSLEPISHRGHVKISNEVKNIALLGGYRSLYNEFTNTKRQIKLEQQKKKVYKKYKQGISKWKIKKEFRLEENQFNHIIKEMIIVEKQPHKRDKIKDLRTKLTLINDWIKIFKISEEEMFSWEEEKELNKLFEFLSDKELYLINRELYKIVEKPRASKEILDLHTVISRVLEYRMRKRHKTLYPNYMIQF